MTSNSPKTKMIQLQGSQPEHTPTLAPWEKILGVFLGVAFITAIFAVVVINPTLTPDQYIFFKFILALAFAGVTGILGGYIQVEGKLKSLSIRAGGAIAVFVLVLTYTPQQQLLSSAGPTTNFEQKVEAGGTAVTNTGSGNVDVNLGKSTSFESSLSSSK